MPSAPTWKPRSRPILSEPVAQLRSARSVSSCRGFKNTCATSRARPRASTSGRAMGWTGTRFARSSRPLARATSVMRTRCAPTLQTKNVLVIATQLEQYPSLGGVDSVNDCRDLAGRSRRRTTAYTQKGDPLIGSRQSPGGGHEAAGRNNAKCPWLASVRVR